jgi:hypothetical protein
MRKIEQQMLDAIHDRRNWKCANTEIVATVFTHADNPIDRVTVYLHGSPIATIAPDVVSICDCGWQTPTTKSRINAVLRTLCNACVYQDKKVWWGCANEDEWEIEKGERYLVARV